MADQKISALTSIAGANIVTSTDIIPLVDTSASQTKQITFDEFAIALNVSTANQAQMETASTSTVTVRPSMTHFHPGVSKAWGNISPPTTVNVSWPATGVSVTNPSTGTYKVTHGRVFSTNRYAIVVSPIDTTGTLSHSVTDFSTTYLQVTFYDSLTQVAKNVDTGFSYECFGDL